MGLKIGRRTLLSLLPAAFLPKAVAAIPGPADAIYAQDFVSKPPANECMVFVANRPGNIPSIKAERQCRILDCRVRSLSGAVPDSTRVTIIRNGRPIVGNIIKPGDSISALIWDHNALIGSFDSIENPDFPISVTLKLA